MKHHLYTLLTAIILALGITMNTSAKRAVVPQMYMFGFAASFNDSTVYFTEIQRVDSAWVDLKTRFLQSRDIYSGQLRDYLSKKENGTNRTCVVFYNKDRTKLEKQFVKLRRLYTTSKDGRTHFDVRQVNSNDFTFKSTDLTGIDEEMTAQEAKAKSKAKAKKKGRKK